MGSKEGIGMLSPSNRALLTDELAPPRGFQLSHAVGTSFTLDLTAALSVPLALTKSAPEDEPETSGIMAALMRIGDRIDVFTQAGAWGMSGQSDLASLLEQSIHPVVPRTGICHPKLWLVEYTRAEERRHRLICSSRNLTFDASWDTLMVIDEKPTDAPSPEAAARNEPLVALLSELAGRSQPALPAGRRRRLDEFADRLRNVEWDISPHYDLQFHALGLPTSRMPDLTAREALIVSPFVTPDGLDLLAERMERVHLVSRAETLDALGTEASTRRRLKTSVLDSAVEDPAHADRSAEEPGDDAPASEAAPAAGPSGLHAKLISCARGHRARLFLGSANATRPGWRQNLEMMVELEGRRQELGPGTVRDSLGSLLVPYEPTDDAEDSSGDEGLSALEHQLFELAMIPLRMRISGDDPHTLEVRRREEGPLPTSASSLRELRWNLLTREDLGASGLPGDEQSPTQLHDVPTTDITPFLRLTAVSEAGERRSTLVLAELEDDPPHRRESIIARRLTDPSKLIELLLMLLDSDAAGVSAMSAAAADRMGNGASGDASFPGLLETLLQALASGSDGLDDARRIVEHISQADDGPNLPPQFLQLWNAAWEAHRTHSLATEEHA